MFITYVININKTTVLAYKTIINPTKKELS